jgi:hypothetical protein
MVRELSPVVLRIILVYQCSLPHLRNLFDVFESATQRPMRITITSVRPILSVHNNYNWYQTNTCLENNHNWYQTNTMFPVMPYGASSVYFQFVSELPEFIHR